MCTRSTCQRHTDLIGGASVNAAEGSQKVGGEIPLSHKHTVREIKTIPTVAHAPVLMS